MEYGNLKDDIIDEISEHQYLENKSYLNVFGKHEKAKKSPD